LQDSQIRKILDLKKYYMRSYSKDSPLLLNEGVSEGRYHWLFEVPVMVTYMDRAMKDYKTAKPTSQMLVIKIQVGRSAQLPEAGMVIEHWTARTEKAAK
jgi:hypothetical protein